MFCGVQVGETVATQDRWFSRCLCRSSTPKRETMRHDQQRYSDLNRTETKYTDYAVPKMVSVYFKMCSYHLLQPSINLLMANQQRTYMDSNKIEYYAPANVQGNGGTASSLHYRMFVLQTCQR